MPRTTANPDQFTMSFGDHLEELRRRLILSLAAPLPLMFLFLLVSERLLWLLIDPLIEVLEAEGLPAQLQNLVPAEMFITQLKLSFIAALIVSGPWVLYQFWQFIKPGLYRNEQRFVYFLVPFSAVLTAAAVALMYWVMLPVMLQVLVMFGAGMQRPPAPLTTDPQIKVVLDANPQPPILIVEPANPKAGTAWLLWPDMELFAATAGPDGAVLINHIPKPTRHVVAQVYRVSTYVSFVLMMFLGIVLAFQMPLVIMLLGWLGLISPQTLRSKRRHALLILAIIAAVVTPSPDPLSMIVMLLPLYGLFELGIFLLRFAPARAVSEGRVFSLRRSDKAVSRAARTEESAQTERPDESTRAAEESRAEQTDESEAGQ